MLLHVTTCDYLLLPDITYDYILLHIITLHLITHHYILLHIRNYISHLTYININKYVSTIVGHRCVHLCLHLYVYQKPCCDTVFLRTCTTWCKHKCSKCLVCNPQPNRAPPHLELKSLPKLGLCFSVQVSSPVIA